jgi:hypothetical protein
VVSDMKEQAGALTVRATIRGLPPAKRVRIRARAVYEVLPAREPNFFHCLRSRTQPRAAGEEGKVRNGKGWPSRRKSVQHRTDWFRNPVGIHIHTH